MPKALITGVTGQDGHHLSKLLLSKGYSVYGLVNGQRNARLDSFRGTFPEVRLINGDLTDSSSLHKALEAVAPDELYNLGAIRFVGRSFTQPALTAKKQFAR